jgi:hypothetical protein
MQVPSRTEGAQLQDYWTAYERLLLRDGDHKATVSAQPGNGSRRVLRSLAQGCIIDKARPPLAGGANPYFVKRPSGTNASSLARGPAREFQALLFCIGIPGIPKPCWICDHGRCGALVLEAIR